MRTTELANYRLDHAHHRIYEISWVIVALTCAHPRAKGTKDDQFRVCGGRAKNWSTGLSQNGNMTYQYDVMPPSCTKPVSQLGPPFRPMITVNINITITAASCRSKIVASS